MNWISQTTIRETVHDVPSPNWDPRPDGTVVDMVVLHYTGMRTGAEALARMCDPAAKVSAHYMIEENGTIQRLVDEDKRAWHAGVSKWRGHTDINSRSVGIELVNPGHEFGYRPFPTPQMLSLETLLRGVLRRHPIPHRNVVGHADVAPTRKEDPGELFDWRRLGRVGIGLMPSARAGDYIPPAEHGPGLLERIGYDTADLTAATRAFQRHFRPINIDGRLDQDTLAKLHAVALSL